MRVRDCRVDDAELRAVLALLKQAKATVGFLPDQAIIDRMAAGTLLVAVDDDRIVGYLLYDLPRQDVTIRQVVIDRAARGRGIARALIEALVARYESSRQGLGLTCRRDFDASLVWEKLDFTPRGERPGRGKGPHDLTFWWRSFNQPTLFTLIYEADERPIAVIDTNLVIRGAQGDAGVVDRLLADWVTEDVRIAIAPHTLVELNRKDDSKMRAAHVQYAQRFEELQIDVTAAHTLEAALKEAVGDARAKTHHNDLRLASQAGAAGARWFVTDDGRFRRPCGGVVRSVAGIEVLSSADMVLAADRLLRGEPYSVRDLLGTDITVRAVGPGEVDDLARTFLNQGAGEMLNAWRHNLERHVAHVEDTKVLVFCDGADPVALLVVKEGEVLEVPVCRVARVPAEPTLTRQVLGWLRQHCIEQNCVAVQIIDPSPGTWFEWACDAESYLPQSQPIAVPIPSAGTLDEVLLVLRSPPLASRLDPCHADDLAALPPSATAAKSVEAVFHPYVTTGLGLATVRIPIQPSYAAQLFDHSLSAGQLFARERSVALAREQVYFRTPKTPAYFTRPTRILWQVTGKAAYGGGTLRGWSLLNDCVIGDVDQLIERFSHLGVLDRSKIRTYAQDGQVMALRFSHTSVFTRPITLDQYREAMSELEPGKDLGHAGPQPVTEQMFVHLHSMGA